MKDTSQLESSSTRPFAGHSACKIIYETQSITSLRPRPRAATSQPSTPPQRAPQRASAPRTAARAAPITRRPRKPTMSKKGAGYRLRKELLAINKDRPEFVWATHKETNILLWSFLVAPPDDTVYGGGWYWGRVTFPQDYPFAPPGIQFVTPSGRFRPETKICMSMSDYHPESWNPAWCRASVFLRRRRDSFPRIMAVGVFFFIFEPFRTASGPSRRRRRDATSDRVERPRCSAQVRFYYIERCFIVHVVCCVEINQCVGCTRQFFAKSYLGDDAAVLARSSGEEFTPPRRRAGVASMAWRTTRRSSLNAP